MGDRYSGISLEALRRSRAVLSRGLNEAGMPTWFAELHGTGQRAAGASRTEALRRVREAAASQYLGRVATRRVAAAADRLGDRMR